MLWADIYFPSTRALPRQERCCTMKKAEICGIEQIEYKQIFTGNGWVEHDPEDILNSQIQAAGNVIKNTGTDPEKHSRYRNNKSA